MNDNISTIWLEVGLPNKRKFLICNCYREWGYLNQPNRLSHSQTAQFERWETFINKWESALDEDKEVIMLGDMNIDSLKWMKQDLPPNDQIRRQKPMIDLLFEKIVSRGVYQQVAVPTHGESCLDHLYTNRPEKLNDIMAITNGGSDHKLIYAVRYAKVIKKSV